MSGSGVIENDQNPEKTFFEKRFHRLLASIDVNSDCEFIVGPEKTIIKGHKLMFSAASAVFQAMFYGHLKEDRSVEIPDLSAEGFEGMKTFIYTGDISFKSAINALLTHIAAQKYLVPQLSNACVKFIEEKLQPSEVLEFYELIKSLNITEFEEVCLKIIQEKTDEVVDSDYFVTAETDTIELILKLPSLKLKSEIEVFNFFEQWALAEVKRKQISDNEISSRFNHLKKYIRFSTINVDEFVSRVGESALLTQEEKQAIALSKIKLLPQRVPDSISLTQDPRNFNSQSTYWQSFIKFEVPAFGQPNNSFIIISDQTFSYYHQFTVFCEQINNFIAFKLETFYNRDQNNALFIIKSKFRVLAVNGRDDLVFESEYKDFAVSKEKKQTNYLAVIPKNKLRNECFLKVVNHRVVINIEGSFKVQKILL